MISLNPGSLCDVCAEEYGPHNYPHSIPCGHVLCLDCCNNILQKTSPRLTPSCPFCRVQFTSDDIRLIRLDFGSSGYATPRTGIIEANHQPADGSDDDILLLNPGLLKTRAEARRLEYKVAKVAAKKCSVEEVTTLHKELQVWLTSDSKPDDQVSSLQLSAALLRAILVNHLAHSEATKHAKSVEANLRQKLEEAESDKTQLEAELRKVRAQYSAKAQECQSLRAEFSRHKIKTVAPSLGVPAMPPPGTISSLQNGGLISPPRPQSTSSILPSARSGATSPTSPTRASYAPSIQSPLARGNTSSLHARSQSTAPHLRSMTPSVRTATPAITHSSSIGAEAPHSMPSKARRLSSPPPPLKMTRTSSSSSDEKEKEKQRDARRVQLIQRWIPSIDAAHLPTGRSDRFHSTLSSGHTSSAVPTPPPRYKTPFSAHSP